MGAERPGKHAQRAVGKRLVGGEHCFAVCFGHGDGFAVLKDVRAMPQHDVGRAFGELQNAVSGFVDGGHHFARRIKRGFPHARCGGKHVVLIEPQRHGVRHERRFGRLTDQIAVVVNTHVGTKRHALRQQFFVFTVMLDHGHFVLCERARLIRADDLRTAERFDGGQFADDGVLLRHVRHADGKHHRHHRRKPLGDRGDRQRYGDHKGIQEEVEVRHPARRVAADDIEHEHEHADAENDVAQDLGELGKLQLQGRAGFLRR